MIELLKPVHYFPPPPDKPRLITSYGRLCSDHGSPIWEPMAIYHNTFVPMQPQRWRYALKPSSPAIDAGVELREELPGPLRELDKGRPGIGALPCGCEPFTVGMRRME